MHHFVCIGSHGGDLKQSKMLLEIIYVRIGKFVSSSSAKGGGEGVNRNLENRNFLFERRRCGTNLKPYREKNVILYEFETINPTTEGIYSCYR